jgi:hypothetical protein
MQPAVELAHDSAFGAVGSTLSISMRVRDKPVPHSAMTDKSNHNSEVVITDS